MRGRRTSLIIATVAGVILGGVVVARRPTLENVVPGDRGQPVRRLFGPLVGRSGRGRGRALQDCDTAGTRGRHRVTGSAASARTP